MAKDTTMNFQFTQLGINLAKSALAGETKINFTKAVASSEQHFTDNLAISLALTTLGSIEQTAIVKTVQANNDDQQQVKIPVVFDRSTATEDYTMNTIGLYAKNDTGAEILYAVNGLKDGVMMRQNANNSTYSIDLYVAVGTSDNVTLKVDPTDMVSNKVFNDTLVDYAKTTDVDAKISAIPKIDLTPYALKASLPDFTNFATVAALNDAIAKIPKIDLSPYALNSDMLTKLAAKADLTDMTTKLAAKADTATVNQQIGTRMPINSGNVSTTSFDDMKTDGIWAINNLNPVNVVGYPSALLGTATAWGKLVILSAGSDMIRQIIYTLTGRFVYRTWCGSPGEWSGWQQVATSDDITNAINALRTELNGNINTAKQAAINQIQPMITAEFTKRNAPSAWWNGAAAQYAAVTPKVATVEYNVYE